MAQSNRDRVERALDLLNKGLKPFIEREMRAAFGVQWLSEATRSLRDYHLTDDGTVHLDTQALLTIMTNPDLWKQVFGRVLGQSERSYINEMRDWRNNWAHQRAFNTNDTIRVIDTVERLLSAISAVAEAREAERMREELENQRIEERKRRQLQEALQESTKGQPLAGLRPWRLVVTPHRDVSSGQYQLANFAANLGQVYRGEGADEYRYPREFFQRTYLTQGLRELLSGALRRLTGQGGDAVIELQTSFGGGKTHSLLALYHLFSGVSINELVGLEPILEKLNITSIPDTRRAVIVGYELNVAEPLIKQDGTRINTFWGELAWQLLGREGYELVAEADRRGVSPGSNALRAIFKAASPCLILIDEWVAFVRQLYGKSELAAGTFDANMSFAQALTEAANETPGTLVVATLPESDREAGGDGGREALARLRHVFGRLESPWRPANAEEGFEIVRRRLFEPITERDKLAARDAVAQAFVKFYREYSQDFPRESGEADYERRIISAYPIHPAIFDKLYNTWSGNLSNFQRTRGVLRLMATVIHALWEAQDGNLLILPGTIPLNDESVKTEMTRYLDPTWIPVIESDIDGARSLAATQDAENALFGRYFASHRIARSIYLGTAPLPSNTQNHGIDDREIKLGSVQPGENPSTFGDALRRLTEQAMYLYQNERRYWYSTQISILRTVQDRATQYDEETILDAIETRIKSAQSARGEFARVHVCPPASSDIIEDTAIRLVILRPAYVHAQRDQNSAARKEAATILETRGNAPRTNRNTLVFLAADRARMEDLKSWMRRYRAWESVYNDREVLNLDAFQNRQTIEQRDDANKRIEALIHEAYIWLIVPDQPELLGPVNLLEMKIAPQPQNPLALTVWKRLRSDEMVITQAAGIFLRQQLDRVLWRNSNHVTIKELKENFAKFVYLPRLQNSDVLLNAIRDGVQSANWERETFAYAERWDEEQKRYLGLVADRPIAINDNSESVIVRPDVATAQLLADELAAEAERKRREELQRRATESDGARGQSDPGQQTRQSSELPSAPARREIREATGPVYMAVPTPAASPRQMHRYHGTVKLNTLRMGSQAGQIMNEIVQHLASLPGANVKVTLEIEADIASGIPQDLVRDLIENSKTLKFESSQFEEE